MAFQNGVPVLSQLDLANNLLGKIPFMAISSTTNGRKLLIDSLSEDETSNPGDEAKEEMAVISVNNDNCNGMGVENHQGVRAVDEVRYSVAPSHAIPLEKEL